MAEQNSVRAWLLAPLDTQPVVVAEHEVQQYLSEFQPLPVAFAPAHCSTAIVWQGQIVPIMNLGLLAGQAYTADFKIVVLAYQTEPGTPLHYIALALADAPERITVTDDAACDLPEQHAELWRLLAKSCINHANTPTPIISVAKLDSVELCRHAEQAFVELAPDLQLTWKRTAPVVELPVELPVPNIKPAVPAFAAVRRAENEPAKQTLAVSTLEVTSEFATVKTFDDDDDDLLDDDWDALDEEEDDDATLVDELDAEDDELDEIDDFGDEAEFGLADNDDEVLGAELDAEDNALDDLDDDDDVDLEDDDDEALAAELDAEDDELDNLEALGEDDGDGDLDLEDEDEALVAELDIDFDDPSDDDDDDDDDNDDDDSDLPAGLGLEKSVQLQSPPQP